MKKCIAIVSVTLLLTICTPAYSNVYIEYSEAMVAALRDGANRRFAENVLRNESVALYGMHTGGGRSTQNLGERSFQEIMDCFLQPRITDTCQENDRLQRTPDHRAIDIRSLNYAGITPSSNTALLFTSYQGAVSELKKFIEIKRRPVHLLYFGDGAKNPLFYLSFGPVKNRERLAAIYPFHRAKTKSRCNARCGQTSERVQVKDRTIDFLKTCFSGRLPGMPEKVTYRYPDRPLLTSLYLDCPADTFPPRPRLSRDLEKLDLGMSEPDYYRTLQSCRTRLLGATNERSSRSSGVGIKIAIDLTLSPAKRNVYNKLPRPIREMFAELSGESVDSYPLSVEYTVLGQFEGCD